MECRRDDRRYPKLSTEMETCSSDARKQITTQSTAISTPRKKGVSKTLKSLERAVHVVAEQELITQNCEQKKKIDQPNITYLQKSHKCNVECKVDIHNIFIDNAYAFDSVFKNEIFECLKFYEVFHNLTLKDTTGKVKINNHIKENFTIQSGVKQGEPLSADESHFPG